MTSQGHPYARFRRALERRSVAAAWMAAAELGHVSLADALALCLLVRDREPARYPAAALRWLGRFCLEEKGVQLEEAMLVVAHLVAVSGDASLATANAFASLFEARARRDLAQAVRHWQVELAAADKVARAATAPAAADRSHAARDGRESPP
jgi:hypothetical protein